MNKPDLPVHLYRVTTIEQEIREYTYFVKAVSEEAAEEEVRGGDIDYHRRKWREGEIVQVTVERVKEGE